MLCVRQRRRCTAAAFLGSVEGFDHVSEILVVTHNSDGEWAFLTGKEDSEDADEYVLAWLDHVVELHPRGARLR